MTLGNICNLKEHRKWEDDHTNVDPPNLDPKDWPKTIKANEKWLYSCLGVMKALLAYVIQENTYPTNDDPNVFFKIVFRN